MCPYCYETRSCHIISSCHNNNSTCTITWNLIYCIQGVAFCHGQDPPWRCEIFHNPMSQLNSHVSRPTCVVTDTVYLCYWWNIKWHPLVEHASWLCAICFIIQHKVVKYTYCLHNATSKIEYWLGGRDISTSLLGCQVYTRLATICANINNDKAFLCINNS